MQVELGAADRATGASEAPQGAGSGRMTADQRNPGMARQIAQTAREFEREITGHAPRSVTVVLSDDTLVITLHGALSEAEKDLARNPAGAAQLQEFHRQLFTTAAKSLRNEIERITGVKVREATSGIEPNAGTVIKVFTTGTVVQVFLLADSVETDVWRQERGG